jgi:hypothetical protein
VLRFPVFKEGAWIVRNPSRGGVFWRRERPELSERHFPSPVKVRIRQARPKVPADPTKVQGPLATDVGSRSPFERPKRVSLGDRRTSSLTPLQDLDGIITPADLHFERHHGGVPAIDPKQYSLLIHGMVERPLVFTLDDLRRFPASRSFARWNARATAAASIAAKVTLPNSRRSRSTG